MRLLHVKTLRLEEFYEPNVPPYAILSHRWEQEEVLFSDIQNSSYATKKGFEKIQHACAQASEDWLDFVWVDTCCIDKSSSAELSEAINSMFRWYENADVCYAFLSDVIHDQKPGSDSCFAKSIWFERGWTLQELIAPITVIFFDMDWTKIGTRAGLATEIFGITKIPTQVLNHSSLLDPTLGGFTVARRMSWAANRKTTRIEDRAYSLMGIFSINMPLLYGEGHRAFLRLQEEILKKGTDPSILAWEFEALNQSDRRQLLADCPEDFRACHDIVYSPRTRHLGYQTTLTMTSVGLRVERPFVFGSTDRRALSLECHTKKDITKLMSLKFTPLPSPAEWQTDANINPFCFIGWVEELNLAKPRTGTIGLLDRTTHPSWPSFTLVPHLAPQWAPPTVPFRCYTHVWVHPRDDCNGLTWSAFEFHPKEIWDTDNLAVDLVERWPGDIDVAHMYASQVQGAIALSHPIAGRIAISFIHKLGLSPGLDPGGLHFRVTPYDSNTFPTSNLGLAAFKDSEGSLESSCILSGRRICVRLWNVDRPGLLIGRLEISFDSTST